MLYVSGIPSVRGSNSTNKALEEQRKKRRNVSAESRAQGALPVTGSVSCGRNWLSSWLLGLESPPERLVRTCILRRNRRYSNSVK